MSDGLKNVRHRREDALSRLDFEGVRALLAEYYRRQGYGVDAIERQASGTDEEGMVGGSIDLRLRREDTQLLVRCLHWNDKQVPHPHVRAWQDVIAQETADGSIFATSGEFTPSALRTASLSKTMRLVDGNELRKMLMPLLDERGDDSQDESAFANEHVFVSEHAFASRDAASQPSASIAPPKAIAAEAKAERDVEKAAIANVASETARNVVDESNDAHAERVPAATATAAKKAKSKKVSIWERGSRPATNTSFAVAGALLTMIVLTIVFRDRLDPYLGDPTPQVVKKPRNESPLAGTDYKTDVFAPAIRARTDEPTGDKPKPRRPPINRVESPQPTPDQAIKVIERNTPEMWTEEQRRKAAADKQR